MSGQHAPVRPDLPSLFHGELVAMLTALVRAAGKDGAGLCFDSLGLTAEERLRQQAAGVLVETGASQWRLNKEAEEAAVALIRKGSKALDLAGPPWRPMYDEVTRALHWRGQIIKQWRRLAPQQNKILLAFEQAGWPERIANPLRPGSEMVPDQQLCDTVKSLNKGLAAGSIRFHVVGGDICWRMTAC